jgi:hypothetical protein
MIRPSDQDVNKYTLIIDLAIIISQDPFLCFLPFLRPGFFSAGRDFSAGTPGLIYLSEILSHK